MGAVRLPMPTACTPFTLSIAPLPPLFRHQHLPRSLPPFPPAFLPRNHHLLVLVHLDHFRFLHLSLPRNRPVRQPPYRRPYLLRQVSLLAHRQATPRL